MAAQISLTLIFNKRKLPLGLRFGGVLSVHKKWREVIVADFLVKRLRTGRDECIQNDGTLICNYKCLRLSLPLYVMVSFVSGSSLVGVMVDRFANREVTAELISSRWKVRTATNLVFREDAKMF